MSSDPAVILSMSGQAWLFLGTVAIGAAIGVFFDLFRILRKTIPPFARTTFAVALSDFIFWLAATAGMFYFMQLRNFGEIRLFALLGAACGIALYFAMLSRYVVEIFVRIIETLKKILHFTVITPLKIFAAWILVPAKKLNQKIRSGLLRLLRYGKMRARKTKRNLTILRKKV